MRESEDNGHHYLRFPTDYKIKFRFLIMACKDVHKLAANYLSRFTSSTLNTPLGRVSCQHTPEVQQTQNIIRPLCINVLLH